MRRFIVKYWLAESSETAVVTLRAHNRFEAHMWAWQFLGIPVEAVTAIIRV